MLNINKSSSHAWTDNIFLLFNICNAPGYSAAAAGASPSGAPSAGGSVGGASAGGASPAGAGEMASRWIFIASKSCSSVRPEERVVENDNKWVNPRRDQIRSPTKTGLSQ